MEPDAPEEEPLDGEEMSPVERELAEGWRYLHEKAAEEQ